METAVVAANIFFLFDLLLAITLLWLAVAILASDDNFKSVVLLISFGLLMALTWVRLSAPDIALAEASIGAGLTGPLFIAALKRIESRSKKERRLDIEEERDG